jgi:hypothetical protein
MFMELAYAIKLAVHFKTAFNEFVSANEPQLAG